MIKNIYLDKNGGNYIAALAEGGKLLEYHIERDDDSNIVGNIYKGKVVNVLPTINGKSFMDCTEADLRVLIDNPDYCENDYIDYKATFAFLETEKHDPRRVGGKKASGIAPDERWPRGDCGKLEGTPRRIA